MTISNLMNPNIPKQRQKIDIMYDILKFLRYLGHGEQKTKIMYRINLNSTQNTFYLTLLQDSNLIMLKEKRFTITQKGFKYIETYDRLMSLMKK